MEVIVIVGPTGVGKSRRAREIDAKLFNVPTTSTEKDTVWFDGYTNQTTILFDDFYGDVAYGMILKICDIYHMQMPCKGGFISRNWERVIFTSNSHYENWWKPNMDVSAFTRRITQVIYMGGEEEATRQMDQGLIGLASDIMSM